MSLCPCSPSAPPACADPAGSRGFGFETELVDSASLRLRQFVRIHPLYLTELLVLTLRIIQERPSNSLDMGNLDIDRRHALFKLPKFSNSLLVMDKARVSTSLLPLFAAVPAGAQIIYSDAAFTVESGNGSYLPVNWDINSDGQTDAEIRRSDSSASIYWTSGPGGGQLLALDGYYLQAKSAGFTVGPAINSKSWEGGVRILGSSGTFSSVSRGFSSAAPVSAYIGFRFDPMGAGLRYGWARVSVTTGNPSSLTFHEWAYESTGGSIQVGAVPEPAAAATGLGLLALGAAGLRRQRWLKRKAA